MLDRLRDDFPAIEIESSASGGGRLDFGILARVHRVWLSDSNDALERLRIQHNAALFLPGAVTGSHVGPRRCHTSGRTLDISFRAWTAAQRHLGLEMDPRELTKRECEILSAVIAWYKRNRDWLHRADILRLDSTDPASIGEQHLAEDGSRFVVFLGRAEAGDPIAPAPAAPDGIGRRRDLPCTAHQRRRRSASLPCHAGGWPRGHRRARDLAHRPWADGSLVVPGNHVGARGETAVRSGRRA